MGFRADHSGGIFVFFDAVQQFREGFDLMPVDDLNDPFAGVGVHVHRKADLLEVAEAGAFHRTLARLLKRRQQHGGENRDDVY